MKAVLRKISDNGASAAKGRWRGVATHSHFLRSGRSPFEAAKERTLAWCAANNVAAVGLGSPWEPVSSASYARCEGSDRDLYYAGRIDLESVMHRTEIQALFDDLNARSGGKTLFYIDNETPKRPHGHFWYFGYNYDVPAWHDYGQDRPVKSWEGEAEFEVNAVTGLPHTRRSYAEVLASQRKAGALGVWAHPTSWWFAPESDFASGRPSVHAKAPPGSWWEPRGRFVTNIAAEIVGHLLADGRLDGMVVQGYDACQRSYQELWFKLLDMGATIPGFAENDTCFDTKNLLDDSVRGTFVNMMPLEELSVKAIVGSAKTGNCFATSGPFLTVAVDGAPMGSPVATSPSCAHQVVVEARPAPGHKRLSRLELLGRGGEVLCKIDDFDGGSVHLELPGTATPSYLIARAFGQDDAPDAVRQQSIRHMAITNPVYLRPKGFVFKPAATRLTVTVDPCGPWQGGQAELQDSDGTRLDSFKLSGGRCEVGEVPASAVLALTHGGSTGKTLHILNENAAVQRLYDYLAKGLFLNDYPGLEAGEVPAEAFKINEMAEAISQCEIGV